MKGEQSRETVVGDKKSVTLSCILVLIIVVVSVGEDCNARRGGPLFHVLSMFLFLGSVPEGDQVQLGHGPVMPTQGMRETTSSKAEALLMFQDRHAT